MLIDYRSSVVDKLDELIEDKITVFAITNSHSEVFFKLTIFGTVISIGIQT